VKNAFVRGFSSPSIFPSGAKSTNEHTVSGRQAKTPGITPGVIVLEIFNDKNRIRLNGFLVGTHAACTDIQPFGLTIDRQLGSFHIGFPSSIASSV